MRKQVAQSERALLSLLEQFESTLILLRQLEYTSTWAHGGTCPICGWPSEGHNGPGRYKGNAENTHEAGCSMDAVLRGRPAPRLATLESGAARNAVAERNRELEEITRNQRDAIMRLRKVQEAAKYYRDSRSDFSWTTLLTALTAFEGGKE
jgi:hypothetical protein